MSALPPVGQTFLSVPRPGVRGVLTPPSGLGNCGAGFHACTCRSGDLHHNKARADTEVRPYNPVIIHRPLQPGSIGPVLIGSDNIDTGVTTGTPCSTSPSSVTASPTNP